ncbi:AAA family ATPase (plasmid) [Rhizobium sp. CB3090]|uniref:AAA family ATPase n=1 Tax=Rhizobium sp. CB3090 TaxID=3039156 RepID=UPI0024B0F1B2|nr:AAA family ATPase [Rhizobium sp. CB3090]WFU12891.1 AAA family ATPase [Rhizobium sp. CB3090]
MLTNERDHLQRILIFGNGGTGKTRFACEVGTILKRSVIHLDDLRWQPGQYGVARDNSRVFDDVVEAGRADTWLMEGVYGWLANAVLDRVTALIWIDLPEEECVANVRGRGVQGGGNEADLKELIEWVRDYRRRENSSTCYSGHARLFKAYSGLKVLLTNRAEISAFAQNSRISTA